MAYSLSKDELCSYLVRYHGLDTFDNFSGEAGIKKVFQRLGCIQYDPLNVVGRNPCLVLQSRVKGFTQDMLDKLLYRTRFLIDGWDKEMSIYQTTDWPYFDRIRKRRDEGTKSMLAWREQEEVLSYVPQVLDEIRQRGHLSATDIDLGACKPGRWGHKKASGAVLDYLYAKGDIGVYQKKGVQKIYGMTEDLLPKRILHAQDPLSSDDDFCEWYFLRRIGSIGVHWLKNGGGWNGHYLSDPQLRKRTFASLEEKGLIIPVAVPDISEPLYVRKQDLRILNKEPQYDDHIRVLAPLDNLLWDRALVQKLFDFQYTWEVYVPEVKRKYGYYVLPVLYRNKLIARMEPVKQEPGMPFSIKNWWWEAGVKKTANLKSAVAGGLKLFARYAGADGLDPQAIKGIMK
jgi:uncharacterized protein YcaQ